MRMFTNDIVCTVGPRYNDHRYNVTLVIKQFLKQANKKVFEMYTPFNVIIKYSPRGAVNRGSTVKSRAMAIQVLFYHLHEAEATC